MSEVSKMQLGDTGSGITNISQQPQWRCVNRKFGVETWRVPLYSGSLFGEYFLNLIWDTRKEQSVPPKATVTRGSDCVVVLPLERYVGRCVLLQGWKNIPWEAVIDVLTRSSVALQNYIARSLKRVSGSDSESDVKLGDYI